jgi:ATPase family associated with various cellular activities (AAA)
LKLNPTEIGVMLTAGFGAVTMLWGNIKGIFARLESLIIVKAQLPGFAGEDFMDYCWAHFKSSEFGVRKFSTKEFFIRPKNRTGKVCSEITGDFITFWKGYRPIFISVSQDKNSTTQGDRLISFIRGTFNLEKLLIDSTNFCDTRRHEKLNGSNRYYVKRCFGKKRSKERDEAPMLANKSYPDDQEGFRPLFYNKNDLGVPTSNRPMDNLSYENSVQEFYKEVCRWKDSKEWFKSKGLPWRFGAGIFGPPGTGKTSLSRAIGQSLDMPIHSYDLTTMDNEDLVENWQYSLSESPCIVLLEDIDRIFNESKQIRTAIDKSPLTLDCLLNCISGVQPSDGILVLVTANDITKLDPALGVPDPSGKSTRPGRLDRAIYVGILNKEGREKIAKRILSDVPELIEKVVDEGEGETGAQFEGRCSKLALEMYWGEFKVYGENKITKSRKIPCAAHDDYPPSGYCSCD